MRSRTHAKTKTFTEIEDEKDRRRILHLTLCLLPKSHRDTLEVLFQFLVWTSSFSQVDEESGSKMDTHNLATVITPNILKERSQVVGQDENSFLAIEVINTLIEYNDEMCEVSRFRSEPLAFIFNDLCVGSRGFTVHPCRHSGVEQLIRYNNQRNLETLWRHWPLTCSASSNHRP